MWRLTAGARGLSIYARESAVLPRSILTVAKLRVHPTVHLYPTLRYLVREDGTIESIYTGTLGLAGLRGDIRAAAWAFKPGRLHRFFFFRPALA